MTKIVPHLWFADRAEEAARFYVSLLPDSRIDSVTTMPADSPERPARLGAGRRVHARRPAVHGDESRPARPIQPRHLLHHQLRHAGGGGPAVGRASEGGAVEQCGWLKDRYGVSWQIVPTALGEMMKDKDRAKAAARRRGDAEDGQARHRRPPARLRRRAIGDLPREGKSRAAKPLRVGVKRRSVRRRANKQGESR